MDEWSYYASLTFDFEEERYDPVGSHLIELRKFYLKLCDYRQILLKPDSKVKKADKKQKFSIPKFPENYPFCHSFIDTSEDRRNAILQWKSVPSASNIEIKRKKFIGKVLKQTGFYCSEDDTVVVGYLSDLLHIFFQKIAKELCKNKLLSRNGDAVAVLEKTLKDLGVGGIHPLHTFYYENFVKRHDILYGKCLAFQEEVKALRTKQHH